MSKDYASRKSFSSEVHPKSSGDIATNEDQIVLPFNWQNNTDKTLVKVYTKDGYQLDLMRGMSALTELDRADTLYVYDDSADEYFSVSVGVIEGLLSAHENPAVMHGQHKVAAGTASGTISAGAWRTAPYNYVRTNEIDGASLSSNQITLPAGKYYIDIYHAVFYVNRFKSRLYNVTDSTTEIIGHSGYSDQGDGYNNDYPRVIGVVDLSKETVLEFQVYVQTGKNDYGWGFNTSSMEGTDDVWGHFYIEDMDSIRGPMGNPPAHEWNGPYIRFENPDGSWGDWQNLQVDGEGEQISLPIGYVYMQLPGEDDPSTLNLAGTWDNISSEYAGDFFRVEGGNALAFGGGQQLDQMQRLIGRFNQSDDGIYTGGTPDGVFSSSYDVANRPSVPTYSGGHGLKFDSDDSPNARVSSTTDGETRPVNQTMRVWERIS